MLLLSFRMRLLRERDRQTDREKETERDREIFEHKKLDIDVIYTFPFLSNQLSLLHTGTDKGTDTDTDTGTDTDTDTDRQGERNGSTFSSVLILTHIIHNAHQAHITFRGLFCSNHPTLKTALYSKPLCHL